MDINTLIEEARADKNSVGLGSARLETQHGTLICAIRPMNSRTHSGRSESVNFRLNGKRISKDKAANL